MGACSSKDATATERAHKARQQQPPQPNQNHQSIISDVDRAILDLKNARDKLQRYRQKLEKDDAKLVEKARRAKQAGKHEQALGLLRLRRYKQAQAQSCEEQLLNVLQMVETIDSKQNETQVLAAMASGKNTLQKMHEETTVDDVLELMDSIRQEAEVEHDINELLQGVPTLSPADEEAVEAELLALMDETLAPAQTNNTAASKPGDCAGIGSTNNLPVAPTSGLPATAATTPTNSVDAEDPVPA